MLILLERRSLSSSQYNPDLSSLTYGEKDVKPSGFSQKKKGRKNP